MNRKGYLESIEKRIEEAEEVTVDWLDQLVDIKVKDGGVISIPIGDYDHIMSFEERERILKHRYPDGVPSNISDFWM